MNNKVKKKKGLFFKICIIVILLILISIIGIFIWQRENIMAVVDSSRYTNEEIASKIEESKNNITATLSEYNVPIVRDFTIEEEDMLIKGELSPEDAVAKILKQNSVSENENTDSNNNIEDTSDENDNQLNKEIGEKIAEVYGIKAYYLGQIGALESKVKEEYKALPEGKKNVSAIKSIVSNNINQALSLESSCDSEIDSVLAELETMLKDAEQDTSLVDTIREAYINEKALKKSYYLSLYK